VHLCCPVLSLPSFCHWFRAGYLAGFDIPVTQWAERKYVIEFMSILRVLKFPYRRDMMHSRFPTEVILVSTAYLAFTVVPLPRIASH